MNHKMPPLRTRITRVGQPYVDEPVYAEPKPISEIDRAIRQLFGSRIPQRVLVRYETKRLRWVKPDGKHAAAG